jgi:ATP-dependent DNA helicase RecQ
MHLGAPSSPIAYYQQVGRAGRSTSSAEVVLLPGHDDQDIWRYFASVAFPSEPMVLKVVDVDLRRTALPQAGRSPSPRAAGHAGLPEHRRLPDGSCARNWTIPN